MRHSHRFTIDFDDQVNAKITQRIEQDLDVIRERLLQCWGKSIQSIALAGGFGRGEGGVIIEDSGHIVPINDYDLAVIFSEPPKTTIDLPDIRKSLAAELEISWVDLSTYTANALPRLKYTMYNYDLKYAAQIIYGDEHILSMIPDMDAAQMPYTEAEIEFHTRMWCFLGPFSTRFFTEDPTSAEKFFLANQFSKAIITCATAQLILHGQYHSSYQERLRLFTTTFPDHALIPYVNEAFMFKLKPTRLIDYDTVERWYVIRQHYLDTMRSFLQKMYRKEFAYWDNYAFSYRSTGYKRLYRLAYLLFKRSKLHEKRLAINLAQLYLVAALDRHGIEPQLLNRAQKEVRQAFGTDCFALDWEETRKHIARLRMEL